MNPNDFTQPPANLEAERGVIGSVLLDPGALIEVAPLLTAASFWRASHARVFAAILEVAERGERVDALTVHESLSKSGAIDDVVNADLLNECVGSVPHAAHALAYAQIVREKAIARGLIEACQSVVRDCYANTFTADDLASRAEEAIFAAVATATRPREPETLDALTARQMAVLDRRRDGEVVGISSGFLELDQHTDGLHPGQTIVLAARPSQGKSALALGIADHCAVDAGIAALFISLEMSAGELAERYLSMRGGVNNYHLKNSAMLTPDDFAGLARARDAARRARLTIDETPGLTISQLAAVARRAKTRNNIGMLVIDYLQLIDGPRQKGESREQEVARVSRRLKALARELSVPVLVLAQLNRQSEGREDRRPRLSDLRESGQLEQDADIVLLLHRPEFYDPNDRPGVAELIIAKNRNGSTGTVLLCFEKALTRFSTLAPPPIAPAF